MRILTVAILLTFVLHKKGFCDAGNCARYEVEIQTSDGQSVRGFVFVVTYDILFQFKGNELLEYLKRNNSPDTLYLYKEIQQLKFPVTGIGSEKCYLLFNAAPKENEIKILKNAIRAARLIAYTTCSNCDVADEKNGYYWNGVIPTVITELSGAEITLLQTKPVASIRFEHDEVEGYWDSYWMISYSPDHDLAMMKKLKDDFLTETNRLFKANKIDAVRTLYRAFKANLRNKGIVLFKTASVG